MRQWMLIALLIISSFSQAQTSRSYTIDSNIHYYADSLNRKDAYINSQCKLDVYYPTSSKNVPAIVWFHGGGITGGRRELPMELQNKGCIIIGVGYRFSPKVKAPAYIEDAAAAVGWAFKNARKYGGSDSLIFVSGHSAGGYLGMMITLDKKYLKKYNIDANRIAGLIPFSGQCITHFTIRQEKGIPEKQPTIDEYAPLYHVRADAPPILLITGDAEMELLGRYEENAYMFRMMKLVGHTKTRLLQLQGFDHGGMAQPAFPLLLKEVAAITRSKS